MTSSPQLAPLVRALLLIGGSMPAQATEPSQESQPPLPDPAVSPAAPAPAARSREGRHAVSIAYLGYNFTWPGVEVSYGYRAVESRRSLHALVVGADLGTYFWPRHDTGLFLMPRIGWRGRHAVGLQGEVDFRIGYLHSFAAEESFGVVNGRVISLGRVSYPMLIFGPQLGVGWFIARWGVTPFARVGALFQYPTFDATVIRFHVTAGVEVRL